jgi:hypothetical protein
LWSIRRTGADRGDNYGCGTATGPTQIHSQPSKNGTKEEGALLSFDHDFGLLFVNLSPGASQGCHETKLIADGLIDRWGI